MKRPRWCARSDEYWDFHQQQELQRVHAVRYAQDAIPEPRECHSRRAEPNEIRRAVYSLLSNSSGANVYAQRSDPPDFRANNDL